MTSGLGELPDAVALDPECREALEILVYCLEKSHNIHQEDLAWESFGDRIAACISKNKILLIKKRAIEQEVHEALF